MNLTLVIPMFNEDESIGELCQWIDRTLKRENLSYEAIFIDDGSTDKSWEVLQQIKSSNDNVKGIKFCRNYGKAAALYVGFEAAEGDVVITMDADLQDSPEEIPELYRMITQEGYDLVSGWKQKRYDPIHKTAPSKFFNFTARVVSGIKLHDFNCGLKAYKKKVIKNIEVYGEMHRYIPILAKQAGFKKIGEKVVQHQARKYGVSKYGWERMMKGYLDLLTVSFLSKFSKSPMYFFGAMGTFMFLVGVISAGCIIAKKLMLQAEGLPIRGVTEQPLFFIALTAAIMGVQLFLAGFLGELISRKDVERNVYKIEDNI
ncbi:MAG: glycosyltransferase family 2 protein [Rikenellaceae bacterium]